MATTTQRWWIGSDILVTVSGVKDRETGLFLNDATVTADLKDSEDSGVTNATGLTGTYVADGNAKYLITVPDTADITDGAEYTLEITITASAGDIGFIKVTRTAAYQTVAGV